MPPVSERAAADSYAKVNFFLHVLAREESGYHMLETLFGAVSLVDDVVVRRGAPGIRLMVDGGVDTGRPERNLAVRAAQRFHAALGEPPALEIALEKRIPSAAGLGGGSSNAGATLRALNALHGEPFGRAELLQMGIELGSDVPFFVCGSTLALAWSRGERLLCLPPLPRRPVLIAHPGRAMPTADAFRRMAERRGPRPRPRARALSLADVGGWDEVAALASNDFQEIVAEEIPVLADALAAMRAAGARIALLAGSGASLFGVFENEAARGSASAAVEALGMRCWDAETLDSVPAARVDPVGAAG